jgi:hypothetical protein
VASFLGALASVASVSTSQVRCVGLLCCQTRMYLQFISVSGALRLILREITDRLLRPWPVVPACVRVNRKRASSVQVPRYSEFTEHL